MSFCFTGDQQQLRPNPTVYKLAKDYKLDVSLFERLIKNGLPYERLELQHRMKPNIAALLVPHIYPNLKNHPSVEKYEMIRGINSNLFFVNHDFQETAVADTSSRANEFEANFVVSFCRYLLLQGYEPSQITILSTYLGQLFSIKQKIKNTIGKDVHCTVVDNFQGEENDIILLSLVRSNEEGKIGFLKVDNRVCVALSRARMGLFCFGNFDFLEENSMIWKPIVSYVKRDGLLGRNLILGCLNHPERMTQVSCAKDFDHVPEGGCNLPCEFRLPCGHQCPKVCHSYDLKHETFKCTKPCPKILCELNHKCPKKCFMECGPCTIQVPKEFSCGHVNMLPCHKNPADTSCKSICKKPLPCDHPCMCLCSDLCSPLSCTVKIQSKSPCGHTVEVACKDQNAENALLSCCSKPCTTLLPCEHPCSGSCCRCNQGRIHQRCKRRCGRTLICGHSCNVPCSQSCPPCRKPCENRCSHSKCPRQCGLPCEPCAEPCVWQCDHYVCTTSCSEFCNRPRCDEPCTKRLPCGHLCIGLCGEPCPHLCRICDKDLVSEIFFGDEDEEDARFVLLEDCQHVIEVNGLDRWMEQGSQCGTDGNDVSIDMKSCPKCKTVIRRNLRYGNVIKRFLNDVIAIKTKIFGDVNVLKVQTRNLEKKVQSLNNNPYCEKNVGHLLSKINADLSSQDIKIYETLNDFLKKLQGLWISAHDQMNTESRFWMKLENRNTIDRLKSRLVQLTSCHVRLDRHSSERELSDFSRELYRINQLMKLLTTIRDLVVSDEAQLIFNRIVENLLSFKPYTEDVESVVRNDLEEFKKANHGLGVSEAEKIQIVKAIGLTKGHWFKCPNGHFYAIGECGGAMERGKCLECKADIGGQSHTLTSGNTLATEMDGATRPAYPTF